MTLTLQLFATALLVVIIAAWIAESHKNGNRFWVWVREVPVEYLYDQVWLGMWRAMMRHSDDPALTYNGRHFR